MARVVVGKTRTAAVAGVAMAVVFGGCLFTGSGTSSSDGAAVLVEQSGARDLVGLTRATEVARAAARDRGEDHPTIDKLHLTTYIGAREMLPVGTTLGLRDQDLVYAVTMTGDFGFGPGGEEKASRMYLLVDGYTAQIMSVGSLPAS